MLDANAKTWSWPESLDALTAAPRHHRLLFENERVRVLETCVPVGDVVPLHTHRWPGVAYVLSWGDFVRRDEMGHVQLDTRVTKVPVATTLWLESFPPHTFENVGTTEIHVVSVELKSAGGG